MVDNGLPYFRTWSAQKAGPRFELAGGDGVWLDDGTGQRWLDLGSMSYQANLGVGERRVIDRIVAQAESFCVAPPNVDFAAKRELADRLLAMAPDGFGRVFFTLGGSEAIENALKIARLYTGRHKLVSRYRSYHGATMGALSLTGDHRRPPLEPGLPGVVRALDCYCDRCPFGQTVDRCARECASQFDELLTLEGTGTVAAVVLETIPGANGVLVPPADYWPRVRDICDQHGTLLVADEVLTGFGRTGRGLAIDHYEVVPDLITVAKGLTAGYAPLGAVLVHDRIAEYFDDRVLYAGLTHYAHPIGIAAALGALDVYDSDQLFDRAAKLSTPLYAGLSRLVEEIGPPLARVRGIGLLAALDIDASQEQWLAVAAALRDERLLVHVYPNRGHIVLAPALVISEDDLEEGLTRLERALSKSLGGLP